MEAVILLAFFVGLAIAAPIWGYDSRDGFTSPEYARHQARWGADAGPTARTSTRLASPALGNWSPAGQTVDAPPAAPATACPGALALAAE